MVDNRSQADNASISSEDSIKPPPPLDKSRIKTGPGALPTNAFDPLKHEEWEIFWQTIEHHFQPINQDHIRHLRAISINPYSGFKDRALRLGLHPKDDIPDAKSSMAIRAAEEEREKRRERELAIEREREKEREKEKDKQNRKREGKKEAKREKLVSVSTKAEDSKMTSDREKLKTPTKIKTEQHLMKPKPISTTTNIINGSSPNHEVSESTQIATLNSFPYTQRLFAAFLDTNGVGGTPAPNSGQSRNNRTSHFLDDGLWLGVGASTDRREYQYVFEDRVQTELSDLGLIDRNEKEELQFQIRHEQWKLREVKIVNRIRKASLYTLVVGTKLRPQALKREVKRHNDQVEMAYLERMVRNMKKNKKSRSKYQKMLQRMFGQYKEKEKHAERMRKAVESVNNGRLLTNGDEKPKVSSSKKKRKRPEPKGLPTNIGNSGSTSKH